MREVLLDLRCRGPKFRLVSVRTVQLLLHYDGSAFAGWQMQPERRTVQGELERVLAELCGERIVAQGAGRTDAGVHSARRFASALQLPSQRASADGAFMATAHLGSWNSTLQLPLQSP